MRVITTMSFKTASAIVLERMLTSRLASAIESGILFANGANRFNDDHANYLREKIKIALKHNKEVTLDAYKIVGIRILYRDMINDFGTEFVYAND